MSVTVNQLNILFVQPNNNLTGQEFSLLERMESLRKVNIKCEIVLPERGPFAELLEDKGFQVIYCPLNRLDKKNPFKYLKTLFHLTKAIKFGGYNVIHSTGIYPNQYCQPVARFSGIPCVVHVNATVYNDYDMRSSKMDMADYVVCLSNGAKEMVHELTELEQDKVKCLYNPIVLEPYSRNQVAALRDKYQIDDDTRCIGQFGEVIPRKGFEYFVEAASLVAKEVPHCRFFIIGKKHDDAYEHSVRELISQKGLQDNFIFTGYQGDIENYLELMEVTALCSVSEGLGRVLVESQKARKPSVAFDIPGVNEVLQHEQTGLLASPKESQQIAAHLKTLLTNKDVYNKISSTGYMSAMEKFSYESHGEGLKKIYLYLLN